MREDEKRHQKRKLLGYVNTDWCERCKVKRPVVIDKCVNLCDPCRRLIAPPGKISWKDPATATKIRKLRWCDELSEAEIAEQLGVANSTVHYWLDKLVKGALAE